ncbi:MAG: bile acid:sodium symporter family protein [Rhodocyclaceae bacterium]|nr:bile acid:sodium symporter family protein [Rhodocyclaceae bacterium]
MRLLLPAGLAFIMFALGLGLRAADFRRVLTRPLAMAAGLAAQLAVLPLLAWLLATLLGLSPTAAAGLMILAACPGGVTAGMVTHLARGETALSISLTALTSLLAFVSVPLVVGLGLDHFAATQAQVRLPLGPTAGALVLVTLLPVGAGVALGGSGRIGPRAIRLTQGAATAIFALIVVATFARYWDPMMTHLPAVGPAALLLNLSTMAVGALLGGLVRLEGAGRVALAMECGMQNSALGITLAISVLDRPELAVPSVVYALLMNLSALAVIAVRRARLPLPA